MIAATLQTNKDSRLMMKSTGISPAVCAMRLSVCFIVLMISCTCNLSVAVCQSDSPSKRSEVSSNDAWVLPSSLLNELEQLKESPYATSLSLIHI